MTECLDEVWKTYNVKLKQGDIVIDIGASEGYFTNWAKKQGASVESFEARNGLAVGPYDGVCEVKGEGLGAYIVPGKGTTKMISLKTILEKYDEVDFLKCDIEGGEYLIFDCDLSKVKNIGLEFHAWTTPDEPIEGLGIKDEPMPKDAFKNLVKQLTKTHNIEVVGVIEAGGYIYGVRR